MAPLLEQDLWTAFVDSSARHPGQSALTSTPVQKTLLLWSHLYRLPLAHLVLKLREIK